MEEGRGPFSLLLAQNRENKVRVGDTVLVLYPLHHYPNSSLCSLQHHHSASTFCIYSSIPDLSFALLFHLHYFSTKLIAFCNNV